MITRSVDELRRAFDEAFARPAQEVGTKADELLAVRFADDHYLLPLRELTGLLADRRIVALPTRNPKFLGVVGIRGTVLPVWDLGALLGQPTAERAPRWLAMASTPRVGLAFGRFDGHVRLPHGVLTTAPDRDAGAHVRAVVRMHDAVHRIVDIPSILAAIEQEQR
ncbi:MAG TPA: chemotaxis protein CheW [Nannocystaceae bacterium]|nr:chemotaxis protein CheW [Nannocystaceae bacterium]